MIFHLPMDDVFQDKIISEYICKLEQAQDIVDEFEMDEQLRAKHLLSLDGEQIANGGEMPTNSIDERFQDFEIFYYPKIMILSTRRIRGKSIKT